MIVKTNLVLSRTVRSYFKDVANIQGKSIKETTLYLASKSISKLTTLKELLIYGEKCFNSTYIQNSNLIRQIVETNRWLEDFTEIFSFLSSLPYTLDNLKKKKTLFQT